LSPETIEIVHRNLAEPNHLLRSLSLGLLVQLSVDANRQTFLKACKRLEDTPLGHTTAKDVAMQLRAIVRQYRSSDMSLVRDLFPRWLMGLSTVNFAPLWPEVAEAVGEVCKDQETAIWSLIVERLSNATVPHPPRNTTAKPVATQRHVDTVLDCYNYRHTVESYMQLSEHYGQDGQEQLKTLFNEVRPVQYV